MVFFLVAEVLIVDIEWRSKWGIVLNTEGAKQMVSRECAVGQICFSCRQNPAVKPR